MLRANNTANWALRVLARCAPNVVQKTSWAAPVNLTRKLWAEIVNVNTTANTLVKPVTVRIMGTATRLALQSDLVRR